MATQFAVMRTRHDRATCDDLEDRRKEAHQEEGKNQAWRDLAERQRKAANRMRNEVMPLIDAKRAQSEEGKGKGSSIPWQTSLSAGSLELIGPGELIKRAREAGVDEVELQQALERVSDGARGSASGGDSVAADC